MSTIPCREYDANGVLVAEWEEDVPDAPPQGLDLAALANQLAAVSETVDFLILSAAGDL